MTALSSQGNEEHFGAGKRLRSRLEQIQSGSRLNEKAHASSESMPVIINTARFCGLTRTSFLTSLSQISIQIARRKVAPTPICSHGDDTMADRAGHAPF